MDKEISNVGTQYIICECGDNFPNEKFLNKHLANGHGEVEAFQCDVCPEMFTSANSLNRHIYTHQSSQTKTNKPELKTYSRKTPLKEVKKEEKMPPVIKLKNLKRIDSISLIENLKTFGGFIKLQPQTKTPEPQPTPQLKLEPEPDPEPEPEPEPEPVMEVETEEEGQVFVKSEVQETAETETEETEEIYYQCDVCNSIFYTEWDFNIHYQSAHALKMEPSASASSAEQILERHLVTDHADDEGVKAEADTAYYYECELGTEETDRSGPRSVIADGVTYDTLTDDTFDDGNVYPGNSKEDNMQEKEVNVKKVKQRGRPKKVKRGRPPKEDVFSNMPSGLSGSQKATLAKKRSIEIRKEQNRKRNENYKKKYPERVVLSNRIAAAKYAENHPDVTTRAKKKYQEKKKMKEEARKELQIKELALNKTEINNKDLNDDVNTQKYHVKIEFEKIKMIEDAIYLNELEIKGKASNETAVNNVDLNDDVNTLCSANCEEDNINMQELDHHSLLKVVQVKEVKKKIGRPKKAKIGRPPKVDVYLDMPPGLSRKQIEALAKKRRMEIRKEQTRKAAEKYRRNNPDRNKKYAKNKSEVHRSNKCEDKKLEKQRVKEETMAMCAEKSDLKEFKVKEEVFNEVEIEYEVMDELEVEFEEILGY